MCKASSRFLPSWSVGTVLLLGLASLPARAQIISDTTLPNHSIVLPDGNVFTIEGGTEAGSNLFHSFQDFSIPTGGEAFFNNATSIENIITRVTGGNLSDIDGLIRNNAGANLFLINPNGIQFGPNARLEIGGSFLGSTAESLLFEDGSFYSATEPNAPPLLTVNVPVGLQMSSTPGEIAVRGTGHNLQVRNSGFVPLERPDTSMSLRVLPGQTLGLLGGPVTLDGGMLVAESGRVELGSANAGIVGIQLSDGGMILDYEGVTGFDDIHLSSQALVDASGEGGSIQVRGRNIDMRDGSSLLIQNTGERAGSMTVTASESIRLLDGSIATNDETSPFASGYRSQNIGTGKGADVISTSRDLILENGAIVASANYGEGIGGNVVISASESVQMFGSSLQQTNRVNRIQSLAFLLSGDAGNTTIATQRLRVRDGGQISATTLSVGNAGSLTVNASELVEIVGVNPASSQGNARSAIQSRSLNTGNAGRLSVKTSELRIRDGGSLSVSTTTSGNAGNLSIAATDRVDVRGFVLVEGEPIFSSVQSEAQFPSPLFQRLLDLAPIPSGDAGAIDISTQALQVTDRAQIAVGNNGTGNAGNLRIDADRITLDRLGGLSASTASGAGGNLQLRVQDSLLLRQGSSIAAEAGDTGDGGNLSLESNTLVLVENSRINANALEGSGGNIQISTQGLFVSPDSNITASSQFGVDGTVSVNNPIVDPASGLVSLDGDPLNPNTQIQNRCEIANRSRFAITGNGGLPPDPSQPLHPPTVWRDTRLGEIPIHLVPNPTEAESEVSSRPPAPLVEATGWIRNDRGQIELVTASGNSSYSSWQPHPDCDASSVHREYRPIAEDLGRSE